MSNAPSVVYPVGRCAFHAWVLVALGGVSGAVGTWFLIESHFQNLGAWGWLACVACVVAWLIWTAWGFLSWFRSPRGTLRWEPLRAQEGVVNGAWSWADRPDSEPVMLSSMERVLDLQGCVLLRFSGPDNRQRWAWIDRSGSPARWNDLRRALVSSCA